MKSLNMRWTENSKHGEMRNAYTILTSKHEGKISPGRRRCKLKNYIKADLKETGCENVNQT
jgi:hypothetical protein